MFFNILGTKITVNGGIETEVKSKISDVRKMLGRMKKVFSCRAIGMNVKRWLHKEVVVPIAIGLKVVEEEEVRYSLDEMNEECEK